MARCRACEGRPLASHRARSLPSHPPPPTPPRRFAEGGGKIANPARPPFSPLPPRAQRVAGRGWGWGELRQTRSEQEQRSLRSHPPPPTPPRRFAEGGGKPEAREPKRREPKRRRKKAPPASAKTLRASCRHPWGQSAGSNGRREPFRAAQAGAREATSRARQTSTEIFLVIATMKKHLVRRYSLIHDFVATTTRPGTGVLSSVRADCLSNSDNTRPAFCSEAHT